MSFIPFDKRFHPDFVAPNKQPLGAVEVDWSHPLARGLWGVFIPSSGRVFNLVDGQEATVTSGATVASKDGQKVYSFDGTSGNSFVANSGPLNSENVTVLSRAHYNATNIDHALLDINNQQLIIWADTSGGGLRPTSFSGSSVVGATGSLNTPSGVYRVWGAQIDNTGTRTAQNWVDGIKSGSSGSVGSTSFGSSTPITFGANSVSAKSSNSDQPIILVWNRTLSDSEMYVVSRDLYQVLKPVNQTGFFVPDVIGGLVVQDLSVATSLTSPALTQHNALAVDNLAVSTTLTEPVLSQHNVLVAQDLAIATSLTEPALTQNFALATNDLAVGTSLTSPALTQHHALAVDNLAVGTTLSNVTLSIAGVLAVQDLAVGTTISSPALTQHNALGVDDLAVGTTITNAILNTGISLLVQNLAVGTVVSVPTLTQHNALIVDDLDVQTLLSNVTLSGAAIGCLSGRVVLAQLLDGKVTITPLLGGKITIH